MPDRVLTILTYTPSCKLIYIKNILKKEQRLIGPTAVLDRRTRQGRVRQASSADWILPIGSSSGDGDCRDESTDHVIMSIARRQFYNADVSI